MVTCFYAVTHLDQQQQSGLENSERDEEESSCLHLRCNKQIKAQIIIIFVTFQQEQQ